MRDMHRIIALVVLVLAVVAFLSPMALAADEGGGDTGGGKGETTFIQYIQYGGLIGYIILLMNVIGIGLVIEHFMTIRRDNLVPEDLYRHIESLFDEGEYEEVMNICETQNTYLTNVLAAGLPLVGTGFDNVEKAMDEVNNMEATKLQQKISYISLIASIAPMLGLLGTVTGMVGAFEKIASAETAPPPNELAGGIQQALVTTCMGLIVAIPMTAFFFYFKNVVVRVVMEVTAISEELMGRFREE